MPSRPVTVIMVAVSSATSFSWPSFTATTSDWVKVRVRPGLTTRPRATMRSPAAGATRLILNSVVSTPAPGGIRLSAA